MAAGLAVFLTAGPAASIAAPVPDSATVANTGSTNTPGWKIAVSSDGTASGALQSRSGAAAPSARQFTIPASQAAAFFADLETARASGATGGLCMKSASFGSATRVTWHDWTSPDVSCPGGDKAIQALAKDVEEIVKASGIQPPP